MLAPREWRRELRVENGRATWPRSCRHAVALHDRGRDRIPLIAATARRRRVPHRFGQPRHGARPRTRAAIAPRARAWTSATARPGLGPAPWRSLRATTVACGFEM